MYKGREQRHYRPIVNSIIVCLFVCQSLYEACYFRDCVHKLQNDLKTKRGDQEGSRERWGPRPKIQGVNARRT